jgi:hypothetical protein
MKVNELIKILENCDPNAEVVLATQPTYPMEYALTGITVRERMVDGEPLEDDEWTEGRRGNDVLLVEGRHLRYGDREAWDNPRTE